MVRLEMKYCLTFLALTVILIFPAGADTQAPDPTDIGVGARTIALGQASCALTDEPSSLYINPAGIAGISQLNATSMFTRLPGEASYGTLAGVIPTFLGNLGFGYFNVGTTIPVYQYQVINGQTREILIGEIGYSSSVIAATYATTLDRLLRNPDWKNVSIGLTPKLFLRSFSESTGKLEGKGLDANAGMQYRVSPAFSWGANLKNFIPGSFGSLGQIRWSNGRKETLPALLKVGINSKLVGTDALYRMENHQVNLFADLDLDASFTKKPILGHVGVEWSPLKTVFIRAGMDQAYDSASSVTVAGTTFTSGLGFRYGGIQFDYAYRADLSGGANSGHYFSISYLGKPPLEIEGPPVKSVPPSIAIPPKKVEKEEKPYVKSALPELSREEITDLIKNAREYMKFGNIDAAIQILNFVLQRNPNYKDAELLLQKVQIMKQQQSLKGLKSEVVKSPVKPAKKAKITAKKPTKKKVKTPLYKPKQ